MISELIPFYDLERAYLRASMELFARKHPGAAERLGTADDPHVGRIVESVAMLNARLRHKIEDEFAEISDALLFSLYPQLISPLPSFFVARLVPSPDITRPVPVPRGTMIETEATRGEPFKGEPCRYQLAADATLLPIKIAQVSIQRARDQWPGPRPPGSTAAALCMRLVGTSPEVDFSNLSLDSLRFYLRSDPRIAQMLAEQFGANLLGIGVACGHADEDAVLLGPGALRNLGLDRDGALLPQPDPGLRPYALLQEYFAYPQKHLFYELSGLAERTDRPCGNRLDLYFYFDRVSPQVEDIVGAGDFELFAVPAINLFEPDPESVEIDQRSHEYRISPGSGCEHGREVHSVLGVELLGGDSVHRAVRPLYALDHAGKLDELYYTVQRRESFSGDGGDDVFLSIADLKGKTIGGRTLAVPRILATNRGLPKSLPMGVRMKIIGNISGAEQVEAITKPTPTRYPFRRRKILWKLISQLSLNHLALADANETDEDVENGNGAKPLKEFLRLYDSLNPDDDTGVRSYLKSVTSSIEMARLAVAGHVVMATGTRVHLDIDDERLAGNGAFMLCAVIERFLSGLAPINSFVQVSASLNKEPWKTWPAEAGGRRLL